MEYRQFERLIIGVTLIFVVGATAASWQTVTGLAVPIELAGQVGILLVLAVALHWGRKGGTAAALVASGLYLAIQAPHISSGTPSSAGVLLIVSRVAGYLLLGIVGGEIFGRIKYAFAESKDASSIDSFSRVYSERFAKRASQQALARAQRYGEPFSIVFVELEGYFASHSDTKQLKAMVRSVANVLRDDVRISDDVAYLKDGRFAVLLPHTSASSVGVVASRLAMTVGMAHGVKREHVVTQSWSTPDDTAAIEAFCGMSGTDDDGS
jgi:GGDEF domain-containing protein